MKKYLIAIASFSILASCTKEKETVTPSVIVQPVGVSEKYYAEILHKEMYQIGDTLRITYNNMPHHENAYPNPKRTQFVSVVLISK
jgi:hypothetical protein